MFDRLPDERLVADLVAVQSAAPTSSASQAARRLIEELVAWQRVSSWVEFQRLDVMRRFELARIAADRDLAAGTSAAPGAPHMEVRQGSWRLLSPTPTVAAIPPHQGGSCPSGCGS